MKDRFQGALSEIKAEDQLKQSTYDFLQKKIYRKQKSKFKRLAVCFASGMIVLFAGLFSYNLYFTETAFVDIDVNPSIELTLNCFDRIIGVYAYNEDGKRLLKSIDIKHKSYQDALKVSIDRMEKLGYISEEGLFTATLNAKDRTHEKELLEPLTAYIDSILKTDHEAVAHEIFSVDSATKTHAHDENLSPAKYLAIRELQQVDSTATFDRCRDHAIGEIKQQTHDHKKSSGHSGHENKRNSKDNQKQHDSDHH